MHICIYLPFCKVYTFRMNLSLNLSSITTLAFFQLSFGRFGSNSRTKLPFWTFKQDSLPHPSFLKLVDVLVHDKFSWKLDSFDNLVPTVFGGFHYDLTDLTKVLYFSVVKVHLTIAYHALCHFIKHIEPYSETVKTSLLYFYPLLLFHESQYSSSKVFCDTIGVFAREFSLLELWGSTTRMKLKPWKLVLMRLQTHEVRTLCSF
jgi:hypothetical protein